MWSPFERISAGLTGIEEMCDPSADVSEPVMKRRKTRGPSKKKLAEKLKADSERERAAHRSYIFVPSGESM